MINGPDIAEERIQCKEEREAEKSASALKIINSRKPVAYAEHRGSPSKARLSRSATAASDFPVRHVGNNTDTSRVSQCRTLRAGAERNIVLRVADLEAGDRLL